MKHYLKIWVSSNWSQTSYAYAIHPGKKEWAFLSSQSNFSTFSMKCSFFFPHALLFMLHTKARVSLFIIYLFLRTWRHSLTNRCCTHRKMMKWLSCKALTLKKYTGTNGRNCVPVMFLCVYSRLEIYMMVPCLPIQRPQVTLLQEGCLRVGFFPICSRNSFRSGMKFISD